MHPGLSQVYSKPKFRFTRTFLNRLARADLHSRIYVGSALTYKTALKIRSLILEKLVKNTKQHIQWPENEVNKLIIKIKQRSFN